MIISIDGPAASGKGTLARQIADHYQLRYLDTGTLYRAVAAKFLGSDVPINPSTAAEFAEHLDPFQLHVDPGESVLRSVDVSRLVPRIAAFPEVRQALIVKQRAFAEAGTGAVLDGRDIGTVVCPDADVKFFVTASPEIRAHRRWLELKASGSDISEAQVLEDTRERDRHDTERTTSPLRPAEDAHLLDTTNLSIEAAFGEAVRIIDKSMR